jgi:hypothetical protein
VQYLLIWISTRGNKAKRMKSLRHDNHVSRSNADDIPPAMAVVSPFPEDLPPALDYNKKMMIWSSDKDRP